MKTITRLLALLIVMMLLPLSALTVDAEDVTGRVMEYRGGVIMRTIPRDDPNAELINIAYLDTDAAYCVIGVPYEYRIVISGGAAPYQVKVVVGWQPLDAADLNFAGYAAPQVGDGYTFEVTFDEEACYMFEVTISDSKGQTAVIQTRPFDTYSPEAETDATTVAGKVNQIVSSCIKPGMSDYARAKVLHDWLIFNADYDHTYTNRGADGVLLKGTGVCDSYARAYQLLLSAAGIESTIVTGYGGIEPHAWNLVKLGGSWYHVDCTWDDPNQGGDERWTYFCCTDEQMAKDHSWNRENTDPIVDQNGMIAPEANDNTFATGTGDVDYDCTFVTTDDLWAGFEAHMVPAHKGSFVAKYTGTEEQQTVWDAFCQWCNEAFGQVGSEVSNGSMSCKGEYYTFYLTWNEPRPYIRINETVVRGSTGEAVQLTIAEQAADMTGVTWASSSEAVATVNNGVVTCKAEGTADITVLYKGNVLDKVQIVVLGAHNPELALTLTETGGGIKLSWQGVPGATEYRVYRAVNGASSLVTTVTSTTVTLDSTQLNSEVQQEVYIVAARVVNGVDQLSYESNRVAYGHEPIHYTAVLPDDTLTVGDSAFLNNTSLTAVCLPDGTLSIGENAFKGCTDLTAVRIPASVTAIAANAFGGCTALECAEVARGSYAESWFATNCPGVTMLYFD